MKRSKPLRYRRRAKATRAASADDGLTFSKRRQLRQEVWDAKEFREYFGKEHDLQEEVERYLEAFPDIRAIRVPDAIYKIVFGDKANTSGRLRGFISKFLKGLPDLTLLRKAGHPKYPIALCVELKKKGGRLSQGQRTFARVIPLVVVRSMEEFQQEFRDWRNAQVTLSGEGCSSKES